jgi:glycosyltransferase involved in cell wall biosynthesis
MPPRRRVAGAAVRLLHVADLSPVKDQATLLTAVHFLRTQGIDFRLDIVGKDALHGAVLRRALELGLEKHVRFHGFLSQIALRERMHEADLLLVSSRHEAGPVVALEAAASGVPTAGTSVGLLADWTPHAARVVDVGDSRALGAAVVELCSNEDMRLQLAAEAQKRAVAENADVTTRRIRTLYVAMADSKLRAGNRPAPTVSR